MAQRFMMCQKVCNYMTFDQEKNPTTTPERSHFVNILSILVDSLPSAIQIVLKQFNRYAKQSNFGT